MGRWLIVHSENSYKTNPNIIGFNIKKAQLITTNDNIIYYIKGGYIKGLYKVSNKPWNRESLWSSKYQIEIEPIIILTTAIDIRPFIPTLNIFKKHSNNGHWGTLLQGDNNIKKLNEYDFGLLKKIIEDAKFEEEILQSKNNPIERKKRLKVAKKTPKKTKTVIISYKRNPDVVAEVLSRANGICQKCKNKAPFKRAKDNSPYLEVHHIKQLSQGGEDSVENAIAVCPNCHRELHYG